MTNIYIYIVQCVCDLSPLSLQVEHYLLGLYTIIICSTRFFIDHTCSIPLLRLHPPTPVSHLREAEAAQLKALPPKPEEKDKTQLSSITPLGPHRRRITSQGDANPVNVLLF